MSARRVLIDSGYRSLADAGAKLLSLLLYVAMARKLGEAEFGIFVFALSLVGLTASLPDLGQDKILTREVARRRERIHGYFADTLALKTALSVPALALALAVAWAAGAAGEALLVVLVLGAAVTAELLVATCLASFQAFQRMAFVPVVLIAQRLAVSLGGIGALLAGADVLAVALIYLAGALLGLALALALLVRRVVRPRLRLRPSGWPALARTAFAVGLAGIFSLLLFRVDTVMLAFFEPEQVVGEYGAAYRLLEATLLLSWGVGAAVYPVLSRRRGGEAAATFARALKLALAAVAPFAAGAAVLAGPVMRGIYGEEYAGGAGALALLAPAIVAYPAAYLAGYLLVTQDRQRALTLVYGAVLVQNVLANLVLIPWLSLEGAALGTSLSQGLAAAVLLTLAVRATGPLDWARVASGPALAGVAATLAMSALPRQPLLAVASGAVAYAATLFSFERAVFPDDARTLVNAFASRAERTAG